MLPNTNKLPAITALPVVFNVPVLIASVIVKFPPAIFEELTMLPVATTRPLVTKLPPVTLPVAVTCPAVEILPPVMLPVAATCPTVVRLPPDTLPEALTIPVTSIPDAETLAMTSALAVPPTMSLMVVPADSGLRIKFPP